MQSILKNKKAIAGIAAVIVLVLAVILLLTMCSPNANSDPTEPTGPSATDPVETSGSTEPVEDEPDTETKTLDAMDEVGPWIGSNPTVQTDADGRVWVGSSSRDEQGSVVLSRAFDPAEDMRGYENGYLHVSIYVEDLSKMTGGQLELTSSGGPDARELSWDLMLYLTKSGWNEIDLPFANANRVGGEIDLKNVNFMRVYGIMAEDCLFGVDEIVLTNDEPEEKSHLDEKGQFVIDEVESLGAWIGTAPVLKSEGAPVGNGYVYTNQKDGDALVLMRALDNLDMTAFKNGYLHVWVYVQNVANLTGGQIELTSSGMADQAETGWDLLAYVKKSGWNELYLPVSQALRVGGGADFSKINYIRVYALTNGSNALGIDYACMSNTAPPAPSRIDANNQFVIDAVESIETWTGSNTYMSYSGAAAGGAWLATGSVDSAGSAVFTRLLTNLDASSYRNGYLHMYLYIQNVDLVTGGQIELSSSGQPDVNETSWNIGGIDLVSGWNDVYLPISEATNVGGGANFGNLNYIRIYVTTTQPQTIGVDYIALSRVAPERDDPVDENGNYIIDNIQGISPWSGSALVYNTEAGHAEGADWLSASSSGTQDMVFFRNFATADLAGYADGYLHVWLYVDDIAHLTGGMIEITSSGTVDDGELYWPLASYVTESGWNELYLPFKDAYAEGATPADMSRMNCIRVVGMLGSSGGNVGIDEIYATNTAPVEDEPEFDGVIDPVSAAADWQGTPITYHENGGYIPAADYITSEGTDDLVFFRVFPAVDASAYAEGGLQLWVYVDDVSKLVGGMIEVTSAGTVDNEELWWPIANYVTESGWNLVYLPFADAQTQGDAAADLTQLDCIRVVISVNAQMVGGIDEVCLSKTVPGTEKVIILNGDNLNATWGNELTFVEGDAPVGTGYIKTGSAASSVVCANVIPAANIQGYEHTGEVHLWLYVEDVTKVIDGQLELTSSGLSDDAETAWNLTPAMLQNGWNELTLKFSDAYLTGSTNYAAVNYMRLYMNFTEASAFGVDEIYVGGIKANVTTPEDDMTIEEAVAAATARSVLYEGSDNMKGAIAAVIGKAANGENITLVTLGDSITAGAVAPAGLEWASLVKNYLEALDGDASNGNVTLVNAGIGSTEAVLGVSRVEKDVLAYDPDLVIVDFGTNDYGLPYGAEAYEGILCKLIGAGVPVINSNVCPASGNNIQDQQLPINEAYGVPMVSFKTAYHEFATTTSIAGLRLNDIWSSDSVHPTTAGHKLLADLLTAYLQTYIVDANVASGELDVTLPAKVTNNGFADAILVENFAVDSPVAVTMDGWTADYAARIYQLSTEGWQTSTVGSSITFKVNAGYFYMFFELDSNCGDLEISVDGAVKETINWAYLGTGYMNSHHIVHLGESGEHTVTITLRDNANVENDWAGICAVGAANFAGYTEPDAPGGTIDMITADSAWGGTYITSDGYAEGADWQKAAMTAQGDIVFYNVFAPKNLSAFADGYLHMWLYVDDIANLREYAGMIELSSFGSVDNEEIYWEIHSLGLKNGWNELYLPVADALAQGDAFDITQADCMRIVGMMGPNGGVIGIDEIYMTNEKPVPPAESMVISEIESKEAWDSLNGVTVATEGAAVGSVWLHTTNADAWPSFGLWPATPINVSDYAESGYLHMWLYVPSAADVVGGQIELCSSGGPDSAEAGWDLTCLGLKDGWNELYLPFADAVKTDGAGGPVNYSAINFIRVFAGLSNPATIGIDKMEAVLTKPETPVEPGPAWDGVIDPITETSAWLGTYTTEGGYTDGAGWEKITAAANTDAVYYKVLTPMDMSAYADGYLHMWLYVDDVANLRAYAGMIELASSGAVDNEEIYWEIHNLGLVSGWNELYLPMNSALTQGDAAFDITQADCMRIVGMFGANGGVIGIDELYMTNEKPETPVEPEPVVDKVISEVEEQNGWDSVNGITVSTENAPVGNAYVKTTNADYWPSIAWWPAPIDVSDFAESGYLHMWLYVPKAADVVGGEIELTSSATADSGEIAWPLVNLDLKDGWNELYLPFAEGVRTDGTAPIDFTNINFIRIFAGITTPDCIGIDKLVLTMTKPEETVEDLTISTVDTLDAWFGADGYGLMPDAAVGDNWVISPKDYWPAVVSSFAPFDVSAYAESGYLHMWLYVPNAALVGGGQIELSSASSPDSAEIGWDLATLGLKDGWNELYLPFAEGIRVDGAGGPVNLAAINYIRIYTGFASPSFFGFDKLEAAMSKDGTGATLVISEVETLDLWFGADGYGLMNGSAVGDNWMKSPKDNWPAVVSAFNPTFDVSPYAEEGYLHLWIYIRDASNLVGGQIELSSASSGDASEIGWNMAELGLQTGWNEVYLPFAEGIKVDGNTGAVDLSKINYIRIYGGFTTADWFGFDQMEATMVKP